MSVLVPGSATLPEDELPSDMAAVWWGLNGVLVRALKNDSLYSTIFARTSMGGVCV